MTQLEKERFIDLEWLRFLLGCYVMIYHTAHHYPQFNAVFGLSELTSMGFFATSAFFVLSGFLLAHVYVRGRGLREPASHFWRKRLFNLYPIHIVALVSSMLVVTFMQWLAIPPEGPGATIWFVVYDTNEILGQTHPELFRHYMDNVQLAFNSVLQLFMLQAWNPYFLTFNAPLWSLGAVFLLSVVPLGGAASDECAQPLAVAWDLHAGLSVAAAMGYLAASVWRALYRVIAASAAVSRTGILRRYPGVCTIQTRPSVGGRAIGLRAPHDGAVYRGLFLISHRAVYPRPLILVFLVA